MSHTALYGMNVAGRSIRSRKLPAMNWPRPCAASASGPDTDVEEEAAHFPTHILGFGLLGVNTCPRCIEYLVFGLVDGGVGEVDCSRRIVLG